MARAMIERLGGNLANAGWYTAQGDWKDAAWSASAAIPIESNVADAAKLGNDAVNIAEDDATAERAVKDGEDAEAAIKGAEAVDKGGLGATTAEGVVEKNQETQDALTGSQWGGAKEKGRVLDAQGKKVKKITRDTLELVEGTTVTPDVRIGKGEGSVIDNVVERGARKSTLKVS